MSFSFGQQSVRTFAWRPKQVPLSQWNVVKGDLVQVISGRYKQTQGKVLAVDRKKNAVTVSGVNMKFKKVDDEEMQRRRKTIQKEFPIHVSNVQLVDPTINAPVKVKYGYLEDGTRVRLSKKTGAILPKPDRSHLTYMARTKQKEASDLDTRGDLVLEKTYEGEDFLRVRAEF